MERVLVTNQKGGVGKTSLAVHLASILAEKYAQRVLLVDLDSQGNATQWLGCADFAHGLYEFINGASEGTTVVHTNIPNLAMLGGGSLTAALLGELDRSGGNVTWRLAARLGELGRSYDYVLFDSPPGVGPERLAGMEIADSVLVPVVMEGPAIHGLIQFMQLLEAIHKRRKGAPRLRGIIPYKLDHRKWEAHTLLEQLMASPLAAHVMRSVIHDNASVSRAYLSRVPVHHIYPRSTGAKDFHRLAAEFLNTHVHTDQPVR